MGKTFEDYYRIINKLSYIWMNRTGASDYNREEIVQMALILVHNQMQKKRDVNAGLAFDFAKKRFFRRQFSVVNKDQLFKKTKIDDFSVYHDCSFSDEMMNDYVDKEDEINNDIDLDLMLRYIEKNLSKYYRDLCESILNDEKIVEIAKNRNVCKQTIYNNIKRIMKFIEKKNNPKVSEAKSDKKNERVTCKQKRRKAG